MRVLPMSLSFTMDAIDEVRSNLHIYSHSESIADEELFVEASLKEWMNIDIIRPHIWFLYSELAWIR